jgi:hypothetical protein
MSHKVEQIQKIISTKKQKKEKKKKKKKERDLTFQNKREVNEPLNENLFILIYFQNKRKV